MLGKHNIRAISKSNLREGMNVVLQNPYVNENETIRKNLDFENKFSEETLKEVLVQAALAEIDLNEKASVLSGGQVQLLSIAQAMLHSSHKAILLLDEPTSHIDGASQKTVLDNLFALARENNQTVLMVAHRLDTAVTFCDKILVLDEGEVAQFDTPLSLLVENQEDQSISKENSIFAKMVLSLQEN